MSQHVRIPAEAMGIWRGLPERVRRGLDAELTAAAAGQVPHPQVVRWGAYEAELSSEAVLVALRPAPGIPLVLVVEDDDAIREAVVVLLLEAGYATLEAEHGARAWALLESGLRPSLILLDLIMPVMDGQTLLERLNQHSHHRAIPVVVLTAATEPPVATRTLLRKPFQLTQVLEVVRNHCGPSPAQPLDFQLLFELIPGLYLVLKPDLTIVAASEAYLKATMTRRGSLIGRGLFEAFPGNPQDPQDDGARNLRASLEKVLRDRIPDSMAVQKYDIRRPESEGGGFEERWWSPINSPVVGPDRRLEFIIHRVEDVTDFVRLKLREAEDQRTAEALKSYAAKMEAEVFARGRELEVARRHSELEQLLIGIVSHDLRTPIQSIVLGAATLLRRNALTDRQRDTVGRILSAGDRATRMIRDLLDFTRARVGEGIPIERAPANLHALVREVVDEMRTSIPERKFVLESEGDATGRWDADRLSQLLSNLVSNAAAYSPQDTPVRVRTWAEAEQVAISIHNQGDPIPARLLPSLFKPLNRGPRVAHANRSIGLGLFIAQSIAQAHGGRIEADSAPERGTTFTVRLPRDG